MTLVLIGYRGTGKSTIAGLVADQLGWASVDADEALEKAAGLSIREIFEREGEIGFRDREEQIVAELLAKSSSVVALGGGAILREANRNRIRASRAVWLQASPESIWGRIQADPTTAARRPNLTTAGGLEEIRTLLRDREAFYRECAECSVATDDKSPEQVAREIVDLVRG